jgi:hypothetical protein
VLEVGGIHLFASVSTNVPLDFGTVSLKKYDLSKESKAMSDVPPTLHRTLSVQ